MGLSDNTTQKKLLKFCFMFLSKTIYMYKANITLLYLMCAVRGIKMDFIRYKLPMPDISLALAP